LPPTSRPRSSRPPRPASAAPRRAPRLRPGGEPRAPRLRHLPRQRVVGCSGLECVRRGNRDDQLAAHLQAPRRAQAVHPHDRLGRRVVLARDARERVAPRHLVEGVVEPFLLGQLGHCGRHLDALALRHPHHERLLGGRRRRGPPLHRRVEHLELLAAHPRQPHQHLVVDLIGERHLVELERLLVLELGGSKPNAVGAWRPARRRSASARSAWSRGRSRSGAPRAARSRSRRSDRSSTAPGRRRCCSRPRRGTSCPGARRGRGETAPPRWSSAAGRAGRRPRNRCARRTSSRCRR